MLLERQLNRKGFDFHCMVERVELATLVEELMIGLETDFVVDILADVELMPESDSEAQEVVVVAGLCSVSMPVL